MEFVSKLDNKGFVPRARVTALPIKPRRYARPLADRLEWLALIVLPLSSLVAAVSLLGHAMR